MRILVVDDDPQSCKSLEKFISLYLGHEVYCVCDGTKALEALEENHYPMIISDIRMPGLNGLKLLENIKQSKKHSNSDVVLITGNRDVESAIEALRKGAYDYLLKPIEVEELAVVIDKVAEHQTLLKENSQLKSNFENEVKRKTEEIDSKLKHFQSAYEDVAGIGKIGVFSQKMRDIVSLIGRYKIERSISVLIEGETGTGKEVFARMLHTSDKNRPFVTINCSAISPSLFESELFGYEAGSFTGANKRGSVGKLEMAQGGTIFLDEIGDMPLEMQPKLLRALQQREIYRIGGTRKIKLDVKFICATNRDLSKMIADGTFRQDLYYRLNLAHIMLPPLRERKEEIGPLAQMFLKDFSLLRKRNFKYIAKEALSILEQYDWPGNIRELQNTIERITLLHDNTKILPEHLSFVGSDKSNNLPGNKLIINLDAEDMNLDRIEKQIIEEVLKLQGGNISHTADILGISRNRLKRKLIIQ